MTDSYYHVLRALTVATLIATTLLTLGCGTSTSERARTAVKQDDFKDVAEDDRAALEAVYDHIEQFMTDDVGRVVAIKYASFDLTFQFDDSEASRLAKLVELRRLELPVVTNALTDAGMTELAKLSKLQVLMLSGTEELTSEGFAELENLKRLEALGLAMTAIDDSCLRHVGVLENLVFLDLTGTEIGDVGVQHLASLKKLESLALVSTGIGDDSLAVLAKLTELKSLDIRGCDVTDAGIAYLGSMPNLKELIIHVTEAGGGAITDAGLRHLHSISTLESVNVAGNKVTAAGVAALEAALPGCEVTFQ